MGWLEKGLEPLKGAYSVTLISWLLLLPASVFFTLNSNIFMPGVAVWHTLFAGVIGWLVAGVVYWQAGVSALRYRSVMAQPVVKVLVVYASVALTRSLVSNFVVNTFRVNKISAWELLFRGFWGILQYGATMVAATIVIARTQELRDRRQRALASSAALLEVREQSANRLTADREQFNLLVRERLLPLISRIESQLKELTQQSGRQHALEVAGEVRALCEIEVRETSHRLADVPAPLQPDSAYTATPSVVAVLRSCLTTVNFYPWRASAVGAVMVLPVAILRVGFVGFEWMLFAGLAGFGTAAIVNTFERPRFVKPGWSLLLAHFIWMLFIAAILEFILILSPLGELAPKYHNIMLFSIPFGLVATWLILNIMAGTQRAAEEAVAPLEAADRELAVTVADLERDHRSLRQSHAKLLHGPIQGRLSAVSMALVMHSSEPDGDWLDEAQSQLALARDALLEVLRDQPKVDGQQRLNLFDLLELSASQWHGLLDVMLSVSSAANDSCSENPELTKDVADAVGECLVNSLRHGRARRVSVFVDASAEDGARSLLVDVTDDGTMALDHGDFVGLGGQWLLSRGAKREIIPTDRGTRVRITWPIGVTAS